MHGSSRDGEVTVQISSSSPWLGSQVGTLPVFLTVEVLAQASALILGEGSVSGDSVGYLAGISGFASSEPLTAGHRYVVTASLAGSFGSLLKVEALIRSQESAEGTHVAQANLLLTIDRKGEQKEANVRGT